MSSAVRRARLRVVNDKVDLGDGLFLPAGDYDGTITEMTVALHRHKINQIGKVVIYLSEELLQRIGFPPKPNSTRLDVEADFTPSYLKGDIVEI